MKNIIIPTIALLVVAGCAFDRADPAARSAKSTYGDISIVVSGNNSTANLTIGDGAMAAADGNGGISQPTTMTTTQSPQFSTPAGLDPISAGIQAVSYLAGKGIDAYTATHGGGSSNTTSTTQGCEGGNCSPETACPDGNCGTCSDGSCSIGGTCEGGNCTPN